MMKPSYSMNDTMDDDEAEEVQEGRKSKSEKGSKITKLSGTSGVSDTLVIGMQKSNGSWQLNDLINSSLNWNQSVIESKNPCSDITLWVTALALCYLEKNFSNTKDLWAMVAKKALMFIKKGCKTAGIDYDTIIEKANQLLIENNY